VKIIHIIVQNNTYYSARSRWTKQQQQQQPINALQQSLSGRFCSFLSLFIPSIFYFLSGSYAE